MAQNVQVCELLPELKDQLRKFRFRKEQSNAALILKVDRESQTICLDEALEDCDIDELRESIPDHQPRFIVLSYKMEHDDGRISYPLCFIYSTPRDCKPELQMMYAGSKLSLEREVEMTKTFEIREVEELTEEWLQSKLTK